jgi:trans-2,3-dihydro-3-hydroxyanthranilate isomerase
VFVGQVVRGSGQVEALFDPGAVDLREPGPGDLGSLLRALGVGSDALAQRPCVAALGRPRLLVPMSDRDAVAALAPDLEGLRAACDRLGLLGCYVYSAPTAGGRATARMFAPSIGVPEDIANANSTACLAAHLARRAAIDLTVDMGDSLGSPSTVRAVARPGAAGPQVLVGGAATVMR